jgi:hypothetical protein
MINLAQHWSNSRQENNTPQRSQIKKYIRNIDQFTITMISVPHIDQSDKTLVNFPTGEQHPEDDSNTYRYPGH